MSDVARIAGKALLGLVMVPVVPVAVVVIFLIGLGDFTLYMFMEMKRVDEE